MKSSTTPRRRGGSPCAPPASAGFRPCAAARRGAALGCPRAAGCASPVSYRGRSLRNLNNVSPV